MVDIPIHWINKQFDQKGNQNSTRMHPRNPMFRVPEWMSEEDDGFGHRMSPHWGFGGRSGPWGDRCDPEQFDRYSDKEATNIPIRIEAEAPPGWVPEGQNVVEPQTQPVNEKQESSDPYPEGINPEMRVGNQPQYASKTTSDVTNCDQEEIPRDTRSSSAPPKMKEEKPQTYVSKMNITPQQPTNPKVQKFNNVAKPFSSEQKDCIEEEPNEQIPEKLSMHSDPLSNQGNEQRPGFIRNIPIVFEDEDITPRQIPPTHNNFNQHFSNANRFPSDMFEDPFFNFDGFGSPRMQRHAHQQQQPPVPPQRHAHPQQQHPVHPQQQHPVPPQQQHTVPPQQQHTVPPQQHFQQRSSRPQQEFQNEQFQKHPQQHQFTQNQEANKQPNQTTQIPVHFKDEPDSHSKQNEQTKHKPSEPAKAKQNEPVQEQPKDMKMEKINAVKKSVEGYKKLVNEYSGTTKDKNYLYLDEMLTRSLLELDNIDPDGRDDVRQSRRALIKDINATISALEQKLKTPTSNEPMEIDQKSSLKNGDKPNSSSKATEASELNTEQNLNPKNQIVNTESKQSSGEVKSDKSKKDEPNSESKSPSKQDSGNLSNKEEKMEVEEQSESNKNPCSS